MKLELKHLAPYLPYGLKLIVGGNKANVAYMSTKRIAFIYTSGIGEVNKLAWGHASGKVKPILRPLSDLTKEIEHNGEKFVPEEWFIKEIQRHSVKALFDIMHSSGLEAAILSADYFVIQKLFEWHFDVFGLIPEGLAIDMNTLKKKI